MTKFNANWHKVGQDVARRGSARLAVAGDRRGDRLWDARDADAPRRLAVLPGDFSAMVPILAKVANAV